MKWLKFTAIIFTAVFLSGCNPLNKNSKSGLQVITDGSESTIFLDGQYLEKSPLINRDIKPGEYVLKIQPDDPSLVAYETNIRLRPGLLTVVTWKLAERPELSGGVVYEMEPISSKNQSEVSFITIPDGAIVELQGKDKKFTPVIIDGINPGHNEFEVSLPSYESQKHTINVVPGYRMLVNVKLAKINIDSQDISKKETTKGATESAKTNNNLATQSGQISGSNLEKTQQQVLINSTDFFVDDEEVLRVRDAAKSTGAELGFAKVGSKYEYLGETQDNWFKINFDGKPGWVSGTFSQIE
jgi:uncharacterized protein YgiM (DUF1202 family)